MGPLSGAKDAYGYNGRNEVVSARRTLGGSPVAGFDEDFAYDPIGNRVSSTDYDETGAARISLYTANSLNQYTSRTVPGWASVRGLANADATVAVNGNAAYMTTGGPRTVAADEETAYFFGSDDFDNSVAGGFAELEVSAVVSDGINDFVSVATNRVFVPPANETYAYDADGNMTEDARFRYYWNGENRMIRAEEKSAPNEQTQRVVTYAYDADGRMVLKSVAPVNAQPDKVTTYFWDAYNIVGECVNGEWTANLWGLDIDVTMQGTGGVGGLLAVAKGSDVYLPVYDGNGNITEYVAVDGVIAAHYAYSVLGRQLIAEDDIGFTHRFSTKPWCETTALVEYEFRKYLPRDGRWMSRDLIESQIPYAFLFNSPYSYYEIVGLYGNPVVGPGGINWGPSSPYEPVGALSPQEKNDLASDRDQLEAELAAKCPNANSSVPTAWGSCCSGADCAAQAKSIADAVFNKVSQMRDHAIIGGWTGNLVALVGLSYGCKDWQKAIIDTVEGQMDPDSSCFKGIGVGSFYPFFKDIITMHNWGKIFGPDVKDLRAETLEKRSGVVIDPWESGGERLFPGRIRKIEGPTYWR